MRGCENATIRNKSEIIHDIADFIPDALFAINAHREIISWNRAMEEMTGIKAEDIVGKNQGVCAVAFYGIFRPLLTDYIFSSDDSLRQYYSHTSHHGDSVCCESFAQHLYDGRGSYLWIKAAPLRDASGNVTGAIETIRDITEWKRAEMLTESQRDLAAALNTLTSLTEVLNACVETALSISQMECGGIYLVDEKAGGLRLVYHRGLSDDFVARSAYYREDSQNCQIVKKGKPLYCHHGELTGILGAQQMQEQLQSVAIIPVHYEKRAVACLTIASRTMKEVPAFVRIALESLTSLAGAAIARVKAKEELRKSEEMFRALAENSNDTIMRFDGQCRHLYVSPKAEKEVGIPRELFIGKTHKELGFPDELVELWERAIRGVFLDGASKRIEFMLPSRIWIDWLLVPEFDERGSVKAVMTTARDITERKQREQEAQEERDRLEKENRQLRSSMKDRWRLGAIIGKSAAMQEVYELIQRAAASDANVIVYGESGTGKELAARAIHDMSSRKDREFVTVNCGAIPEHLLESEFFGHKKGAFTGAHIDKHGYLDIADGGSLFLDEIGELGMNIQAKLLRALEGGGYSPVGHARAEQSDFRIIAATNRNLIDHVKRGMLREDFFYRIHVLPIHLPPLRERKEDIPLLLEHFMETHHFADRVPMIPGKILDAFFAYDWPGNVRELQNVLLRYVTLNSLDFPLPRISDAPCRKDLPVMEGATHESLASSVEYYEKDLIVKTLNEARWHKGNAASRLGISRKTLFRKMKTHALL